MNLRFTTEYVPNWNLNLNKSYFFQISIYFSLFLNCHEYKSHQKVFFIWGAMNNLYCGDQLLKVQSYDLSWGIIAHLSVLVTLKFLAGKPVLNVFLVLLVSKEINGFLGKKNIILALNYSILVFILFYFLNRITIRSFLLIEMNFLTIWEFFIG